MRHRRLLLPARICTGRSKRCFRNFVRSIGYGGRPGRTLLHRFDEVAGGRLVLADVGLQAGVTNWQAPESRHCHCLGRYRCRCLRRCEAACSNRSWLTVEDAAPLADMFAEV